MVSVTNILPIRAPAVRMLRFMPNLMPTPRSPHSPFSSDKNSNISDTSLSGDDD
jgi:hypothetical protein